MNEDALLEYTKLEGRVDAIEARLSAIEGASAVTRDAINAVNANIETLSKQMANMDARLVEEKTKWGDITREMVRWTTRVILAVVAFAAGVNLIGGLLEGAAK